MCGFVLRNYWLGVSWGLYGSRNVYCFDFVRNFKLIRWLCNWLIRC